MSKKSVKNMSVSAEKDKKINIKEQELSRFKRTGFSVVEWGGTIHKEG